MFRALIVASLLLLSPHLFASSSDELVVGTRVIPPFVIKDEKGELSGVSIEFWQNMADALGVRYRFEERNLEGLIAGLVDGSLDVSIAALTVTAEREALVDFSHPFHTTGLAIAVRVKPDPVWQLLTRLFSWEFFAALVSLGSLLLVVGIALWWFERKKNSEMFGGSTLEGIGSSFWWAAVTMTTVGYGDKYPTTFGGKVIGLIWMFAAIILISTFTAAIATALTVNGLRAGITGPDDLANVRVGTLLNSSSEAYLESRGLGFKAVESLEQGFDALVAGELDAVVYDRPLLLHVSNKQYPDTTQVVGMFDRQDYALALAEGSALREPINRVLLQQIGEPDWQAVLNRYLGNH